MLVTMKTLLEVAQKNHFAVGAFNIGNGELLRSVMEAAEENHSPVILEIHPSELDYLTDHFLKFCIDYAEKSSVPVVIHLDHGSSIEYIVRSIRLGFTSVMIDASQQSMEKNIELTSEVTRIAHIVNVSVEAELGTIGNIGSNMEGGVSNITYADPKEAKLFVDQTGVDTLAVAIGTAHGIYPSGYVPKLQLDLLQKIRDTISIPLVLHGGSSNPDSEVRQAIKMGICKVNISSDMKTAFFRKMNEIMSENHNLYEPNQIFVKCIDDAKKVIKQKMELFDSVGKAGLYKYGKF